MKADMAMCSATEALKAIYPASLGQALTYEDWKTSRRRARNKRKAERRKLRGK
jgi:hypothetical protein